MKQKIKEMKQEKRDSRGWGKKGNFFTHRGIFQMAA